MPIFVYKNSAIAHLGSPLIVLAACAALLLTQACGSEAPAPAPEPAVVVAAPAPPVDPLPGARLGVASALEAGAAAVVNEMARRKKAAPILGAASFVSAARHAAIPPLWLCEHQNLVARVRRDLERKEAAEEKARREAEAARAKEEAAANVAKRARRGRSKKKARRQSKKRARRRGNTKKARDDGRKRSTRKKKRRRARRRGRRVNPRGPAAMSYKRHKGLRKKVGQDLETWDMLWSLYRKRGICEPDRFVLEGIAYTRFLGYRMKVHASVLPLLAQVQKLYDEQGLPYPTFDYAKGFTARTVRGPFGEKKALSNHGRGKALDFDPEKNRFYTPEELAFIERITNMKLVRRLDATAGERWDSFKAVGEAYKVAIKDYLGELRKQKRAARKKGRAGRHLLRSIDKKIKYTRRRNLDAARRFGLVSMPREFVVAMEDVGLIWGTHFRSGADVMHFQLEPHRGGDDDEDDEGDEGGDDTEEGEAQ